jgi:hypothetical protein
MAENKTKPTAMSVADFLDAVEPPERREDGKAVCAMMERVTGEPPVIWGASIIGFGSYRYQCGKREETMCRLGFSPRKAELVLYVLTGTPEQEAQLARLGKHKIGKACLYIKKLADVNMGVLEEITRGALAHMNERYPS